MVGSLSQLKDQNNQLISLGKHQKSQQGTNQPNKVFNQHQHNQHQNHQQDSQHQNHQQNNDNQNKHQASADIDQQIHKQHFQTNQQKEQVSKKLYVGNLNKDITEEDLNQLFGLKLQFISVTVVVLKCL